MMTSKAFSPFPPHIYLCVCLGIILKLCQPFQFLPKHLPLRESFQWQNSNIPDVTIQRSKKSEVLVSRPKCQCFSFLEKLKKKKGPSYIYGK